MRLEPIAKPVNIRIKSGGEYHSNLSSLKEKFCVKDLWELRQDGRLSRWLSQIGLEGLSIMAKPLSDNTEYNFVTEKEKIEFLSIFFDDVDIDHDTLFSIIRKWDEKDSYRAIYLAEDFLGTALNSEEFTYVNYPEAYGFFKKKLETSNAASSNLASTKQRWVEMLKNLLDDKKMANVDFCSYLGVMAEPMKQTAASLSTENRTEQRFLSSVGSLIKPQYLSNNDKELLNRLFDKYRSEVKRGCILSHCDITWKSRQINKYGDEIVFFLMDLSKCMNKPTSANFGVLFGDSNHPLLSRERQLLFYSNPYSSRTHGSRGKYYYTSDAKDAINKLGFNAEEIDKEFRSDSFNEVTTKVVEALESNLMLFSE